MESPGSATYEIIDVPAVTKLARQKNIVTILDNSWSGGILYKPLKYGVDIAVQSATKYIGGHSDLMLGVAVAANEKIFKTLKNTANNFGVCAGADELYLALRGLRTVKLRFRQQAENALKVAQWLQKQPEVQKIFYPALPDDPNYKLWKRDFSGANSLLSILLKPAPEKTVATFVDSLKLFPLANSWGGYESLLQPQDIKRAAKPWTEKGELLRLHVGLEDPDDLIADLEQAFKSAFK
jgi:cystathionine beta-lyase